METFNRVIKHLFWLGESHGLFNSMDDETYLKIKYRLLMGKKLNLNHPQTYNEKLQWLKLNDRNPIYTLMVDKYEVKKIVAEMIGDCHIIPTLGVWDRVDDIEFDSLPNQFVLKCTHDSGGIVICRDYSHFDVQEAKDSLKKSMNRKYYYCHREWPYKNVKPRIIAEQYMEDESGYELKDYKFFVFDGTVKALFVATDRFSETETCFDFFDRDFHHLPFTNGHPNAKKQIPKPQNYEEMVTIAETLGKGIPHVRVDLYNIKGNIFFGEYTFSHWSGFKPFVPEMWDYTFGSWICLPEK